MDQVTHRLWQCNRDSEKPFFFTFISAHSQYLPQGKTHNFPYLLFWKEQTSLHSWGQGQRGQVSFVQNSGHKMLDFQELCSSVENFIPYSSQVLHTGGNEWIVLGPSSVNFVFPGRAFSPSCWWGPLSLIVHKKAEKSCLFFWVWVYVHLSYISFMMGHNGERKDPGASELTQITANSCLGNWIGMRGK